MRREFHSGDKVAIFLLGAIVGANVILWGVDDPTPEVHYIGTDHLVDVLIYPADALEAGEPQRMPLSQAVRNAAAGVPVTLVGVEGE